MKIYIVQAQNMYSMDRSFLFQLFFCIQSKFYRVTDIAQYAPIRVCVLQAHYTMFVSRYSTRQKAYKNQLKQETIFHSTPTYILRYLPFHIVMSLSFHSQLVNLFRIDVSLCETDATHFTLHYILTLITTLSKLSFSNYIL